MITKLREYFGFIIAAAAVVGIVSGGMAYFAKASELEELRVEVRLTQVRLEQKVVSDQIYDLQKRVHMIEDRNRAFGADCRSWPDQRERDEYRVLQMQLDELKGKQNQMIKEQVPRPK